MKVQKMVIRNFRTYLLRNIFMVFLLCIIMIPIFMLYYQQNKKNYISSQQSMVDSSTRLFSEQLQIIETLLEDCIVTRDVPELAAVHDISSRNYLVLKDVANGIKGICTSGNIASDLFIIFQNSETIVTNNGIFTQLGSRTGKDNLRSIYQFTNEDVATEILDGKSISSSYSYYRDIGFSIKHLGNPPKTAFACGWRLNNLSNTYAYLFISQSAIESLYAAIDGNLVFYAQEKELFSMERDDVQVKDDNLMLISGFGNHISVKLWLNPVHYQAYLHSTLLTIIVFSCAIVLLSIALAIYSAHLSCKPLKQVISKLKELSPDIVDSTETFSYLHLGIEKLHETNESIATQLKTFKSDLEQNILERYLHTSSFAHENDTSPRIANFPLQYVVCYAIADVLADAQKEELLYLLKIYSNALASEMNALLQPISSNSFVLVIPAVSSEDLQLQLLHDRVKHINDTGKLSITYAVSPVYNNISQLNLAYEYARSELISQELQSGHQSDMSFNVTYMDSSKLYTAILEANYQLAQKLLINIITQCSSDISLRQRFYFARTPLQLAQHVLLPNDTSHVPHYSGYLTPQSLLDQLDEFAKQLCMAAYQKMRNNSEDEETATKNKEHKRIIHYILENYTYDSLSVQSICSACETNEKIVNEACRNAANMNASAYIQQLRMDKASSMLRNTTVKVNDILKECGYNTPNAFYKAFKRVYGKTPSEYREVYRID